MDGHMSHVTQPGDDNEEIFNIFVLDYLQKNNFEETSQTFFVETMKEYYDPPIDSALPFFQNWFDTFWETVSFSKQHQDSVAASSGYPHYAKSEVPSDRLRASKFPSSQPFFNNVFFPNHFSIEREKSISSFNPVCVVPPPQQMYPESRYQYNMPMMPSMMSMAPNRMTSGHPSGMSHLENAKGYGGHVHDMNMSSDDHMVEISKDTKIMTRAIVKNGKKCFERLKNNRKSSLSKVEISPAKIFDFESKGISSHPKNLMSSSKNPARSRASVYRGVSRNGNQWQAIIMVQNKKRYIGSYSYENDAARAYDKAALQFHGEKAKTNFTYTGEDIQQIRQEEPILASLN